MRAKTTTSKVKVLSTMNMAIKDKVMNNIRTGINTINKNTKNSTRNIKIKRRMMDIHINTKL